jgi:hypothetical protein
MRSNDIADIIGAKLAAKHSRVYRQKAPATKVFPYVVYRIESVGDTYPSEELYVNIDLYEAPTASVRTVETLADSIQAELNHKVIIENNTNLHFELEQRQSVDAQDLIDAYLINLRFVVRAYFI